MTDTSPAPVRGPLQVQQARATSRKQGVNPQSVPKPGKPAAGGGTRVDDRPIVVVQFSILYDDAQRDAFDRLWAMRDIQHRLLNAAISEWHRAEMRASTRNADKQVLDRGPVTDVVKIQMQREREYWTKQLDRLRADVEKARVDLGRAKTKSRDVEQSENNLNRALHDCRRAEIRSTFHAPSSVYDSVVRFTKERYAIYKKSAFRGDRSLDSYRHGQPIRWRDGAWTLRASNGRGHYQLDIDIEAPGEGKRRVDRATLELVPDGPSMHGYAKKMIDAGAIARREVKLCDARIVYSERKQQWFAKLTMRLDRPSRKRTEGQTAALRRGVNSAFVVVYEDDTVRKIEGADVLAFKRRINARRKSILSHVKSRLEAGMGRARGKNEKFRKLRKISDAEARYVDWRCKTWASSLAAECADRGVKKLLVAKMTLGEMSRTRSSNKKSGDHVAALLHNWPFGKLLSAIERAFEAIPVDEEGRAIRSKFGKDGTIEPKDRRHRPAAQVSIEVEKYDAHYDARTCPECKHVHLADPKAFTDLDEGGVDRVLRAGTFTCEICKFERPSDEIVAWNGLLKAVGSTEPLSRMKERARAIGERLAGQIKGKETSA
jgi:transposase